MSDADEYLSWPAPAALARPPAVLALRRKRRGLHKDGEISPRSPAASSRFVKLTGLKTPG